jgi:hypothetical protein
MTSIRQELLRCSAACATARLALAEAIVIAGETDEEIGVQALLKPAAGFARTSGDVGTAGKSLSARADVMRSSHGVARKAWKVAVLSVM